MTDTEEERRKPISNGVMQDVKVSYCRLLQDEILVQYFEHDFKQQSMEWYCSISPRKKKFNSVLSAGNIMARFFGMGKVSRVNFVFSGITVTSGCYIETVCRLNACLPQVCPT
jgi:hypothetical protein